MKKYSRIICLFLTLCIAFLSISSFSLNAFALDYHPYDVDKDGDVDEKDFQLYAFMRGYIVNIPGFDDGVLMPQHWLGKLFGRYYYGDDVNTPLVDWADDTLFLHYVDEINNEPQYSNVTPDNVTDEIIIQFFIEHGGLDKMKQAYMNYTELPIISPDSNPAWFKNCNAQLNGNMAEGKIYIAAYRYQGVIISELSTDSPSSLIGFDFIHKSSAIEDNQSYIYNVQRFTGSNPLPYNYGYFTLSPSIGNHVYQRTLGTAYPDEPWESMVSPKDYISESSCFAYATKIDGTDFAEPAFQGFISKKAFTVPIFNSVSDLTNFRTGKAVMYYNKELTTIDWSKIDMSLVDIDNMLQNILSVIQNNNTLSVTDIMKIIDESIHQDLQDIYNILGENNELLEKIAKLMQLGFFDHDMNPYLLKIYENGLIDEDNRPYLSLILDAINKLEHTQGSDVTINGTDIDINFSPDALVSILEDIYDIDNKTSDALLSFLSTDSSHYYSIHFLFELLEGINVWSSRIYNSFTDQYGREYLFLISASLAKIEEKMPEQNFQVLLERILHELENLNDKDFGSGGSSGGSNATKDYTDKLDDIIDRLEDLSRYLASTSNPVGPDFNPGQPEAIQQKIDTLFAPSIQELMQMKFPFSLPFDALIIMSLFEEEPQRPEVTFKFPWGDNEISFNFTIPDFVDEYIGIFHIFVEIMFVVFILHLTREFLEDNDYFVS